MIRNLRAGNKWPIDSGENYERVMRDENGGGCSVCLIVESQKGVAAHFWSKQLLPFGFALQIFSPADAKRSRWRTANKNK